MSDAFQREDSVSTQAIAPVSAAATANATSGSGAWTDLSQFTGDVLVTQSIGAVTGSITGKLQVADDANGTGAVDVAGAVFTAVSAANNTQNIALNSDATAKRYLGYVGTIVTGPALVSVTVAGVKKYN